MGCTGSKVRNEECVWRCRQRKRFVKGALSSRNALAAAYAGYYSALKNCSIAFREFSEGEFRQQRHISSLSPPPSSSPVPVKIFRSKALETTPTSPITVVFSPSHASEENRIFEENRTNQYQEYLYNDAPPPGFYGDVSPPPPSSPPYQLEPIYEEDFVSPPSTPLNEGWDFFDLFRAPAARMRFQEPKRFRSEDRQKAIDEEEMPALEIDDFAGEKKVKQKKTEDYADFQNEEEKAADIATSSEASSSKLEENSEPTEKAARHKNKYLPEVLREIDENFLTASASAKDVCRLLEVNKLQHSSNFSDSKGSSDHSARFLSSVSRGYFSPKTPLSWTSASEDSTAEETLTMKGSLASTQDTLYAWEKKLYEQMKETEVLHVEFERHRKRLRTLDARGEGDVKIDRTRAAIKSLETEMVVSVEAISKTSSEIRKMAEEEMYPQLLDLLEGLTNMSKEMSECHRRQKSAALSIIVPSISLEATSISHRHVTVQLEAAIEAWQTTFSNIMRTQKEYMQNLNGWLEEISMFKPENESKHRADSLLDMSPRIFQLCQQWKSALDTLQEKPVLDEMKKFIGLIRDIIRLQKEEAGVQKSVEFLSKELKRKVIALNNAHRKYSELGVGQVQEDNSTGEKISMKGPLSEKKEAVESLKVALEREQAKFTQAIKETREQTMKNLESGLPDLFSAFSEFASIYSHTYQEIRSQARNGKLVRE